MTLGSERLIYALDTGDARDALAQVSLLRNSVGVFKVGLELFVAAGPDFIGRARARLRRSGTAASFFLDLKLHDIPITVERSAAAAARTGAEFLTAHAAGGRAMLAAAVNGAGAGTKVLAVTVLTSVPGSELIAQAVLDHAETAAASGCAGVVCSPREAAEVRRSFPRPFLIVTPGVRARDRTIDADDQERTGTPGEAIRAGADYLVLGRPLRQAPRPRAAARAIAREVEAALKELGV